MAIKGPGAAFQFAEMSFFAQIYPTRRGEILRFVKHNDFIRMYKPDCCTRYNKKNGLYSENPTCPKGTHNWLRAVLKVYKTNAKDPFAKWNESNKRKYPDILLTVDFYGDLAHALTYAKPTDILYIKAHMHRRWSSFSQQYFDSFTAYRLKIINEQTVQSMIKTTVMDRYRESVMNFFYLTRYQAASRYGAKQLREELKRKDPIKRGKNLIQEINQEILYDDLGE